MSVNAAPAGPAAGRMSREERKVLAGTLVGTTIEWYDFFIYAQAAGLVLATLYFGPINDGPLGQVVSFATIGISFLFRPLGAVVAGHLGDRIGRKKMLVFTLVMTRRHGYAAPRDRPALGGARQAAVIRSVDHSHLLRLKVRYRTIPVASIPSRASG